jgi:hypothetical protein
MYELGLEEVILGEDEMLHMMTSLALRVKHTASD